MASLTKESPKALGDYELLYEIKSGGMGQIYLARKHGTGGFEKLVAIKTILGEYSSHPGLRTMFLDEAQLLSRLDHPAVAQVHDFGEQDDMLFLAMEYIAGIRFGELRQLGAPPGLIIRLIAQVCRALHAAHQLQDIHGEPLHIVHRDVSPDNLMFSFDGNVKVLDFGIALIRGRQAPVTEFGTVKGKPPYLSPEQMKGERLDCRSDIWAVGVVLWELLVGEHLFEGDSIYAIARAIEEQSIDPPSTRTSHVPKELDTIVARALERNPDKRYSSAQDMASDLERLAAKLQVPSCAEFANQLLGEEQKKHKLWLRDILTGSAKAVPKAVGRPQGMQTVAAGSKPVAPESSRRDTRALSGDSLPKSKLPLSILATLGLALTGGAAWVLMSGDQDSEISTYEGRDAAAVTTTQVPILDAEIQMADAATVFADAGQPADDKPTIRAKKRRDTKAPKTKTVLSSDTPVEVKQPKKTDPPPIAGFGTITVAADPYALVRVDGKGIGSTPIFKRKIPAGPHTVTLIHPDTGTVRLQKTINLAADGHKKVIAR